MNINQEIVDKARQILRERGYVDMCIMARICPACGEKIKLDYVKASGSCVPKYVNVTCQSENCAWSAIR